MLTVYGAAPVPGLGVRGGFNQNGFSRGDGLGQCTTLTEVLVWSNAQFAAP